MGASSGIEGQALIGPTCPVARPGDRKCADRPYHTTVIVKTLDGREVARVTTDAYGKFRVALEPDYYVISVSSAKRMQLVPVKSAPITLKLPDNQVQVVPGQFTSLKLMFDSGIR
jgi:C4-type Zn-finger protein